MVFVRRIQKFVAFLFLSAFSLACVTTPKSPFFESKGEKISFDFNSNQDFHAYIKASRKYLKKQRTFHTPFKEIELDLVSPFKMERPAHCRSQRKKGALLVHGLLDSAFAMRDIARGLNQKCMLIQAVLLPGHGTKPADLIFVKQEEWIETVKFGIDDLKRQVDDVYVVGYSLGGLLAINASYTIPDIKGVIALSPAVNVGFASMAAQARWIKYLTDFPKIHKENVKVRYSSPSVNSVAEIYSLSQSVQKKILSQPTPKTKILMYQSADEITIDTARNQWFFENYFAKNGNQLIVYGESKEKPTSQFIEFRSSYFPKYKVLNYSHASLPYHPNNPIYGQFGSHKECGVDIGGIDQKLAKKCLTSFNNWKGEFDSTQKAEYLPLQRASFNPDFDRMIEDMVNFTVL